MDNAGVVFERERVVDRFMVLYLEESGCPGGFGAGSVNQGLNALDDDEQADKLRPSLSRVTSWSPCGESTQHRTRIKTVRPTRRMGPSPRPLESRTDVFNQGFWNGLPSSESPLPPRRKKIASVRIARVAWIATAVDRIAMRLRLVHHIPFFVSDQGFCFFFRHFFWKPLPRGDFAAYLRGAWVIRRNCENSVRCETSITPRWRSEWESLAPRCPGFSTARRSRSWGLRRNWLERWA